MSNTTISYKKNTNIKIDVNCGVTEIGRKTNKSFFDIFRKLIMRRKNDFLWLKRLFFILKDLNDFSKTRKDLNDSFLVC